MGLFINMGYMGSYKVIISFLSSSWKYLFPTHFLGNKNMGNKKLFYFMECFIPENNFLTLKQSWEPIFITMKQTLLKKWVIVSIYGQF